MRKMQKKLCDKITFIEAVLLIDKHPDFELCDSEKEQRGEYDVCVTHNDSIVLDDKWYHYDRMQILPLVSFLVLSF